MKAQADAEAANETRDMAKPIPTTDYMAMRQSFAKSIGELEDKYIPSKEYIEKKLAELASAENRKLARSDKSARNRSTEASSSSRCQEVNQSTQQAATDTSRLADSAPVEAPGKNWEAAASSTAATSTEASGDVNSTTSEVLSRDREKLISHALSKILRHAHRLPMNQTGYAPTRDLLKAPVLKSAQVRPAGVRTAVMTNKKQRFQIMTEGKVEYVRAVQGHDSAMAAHYGPSDQAVLQELTMHTAPDMAVHGTQLCRYGSIREEGLSKRRRTHVHFIPGETAETARRQNSEISGLRANAELLPWVDVHKCYRQGITFFRAPNNVLLSPGKRAGSPRHVSPMSSWPLMARR